MKEMKVNPLRGRAIMTFNYL